MVDVGMYYHDEYHQTWLLVGWLVGWLGKTPPVVDVHACIPTPAIASTHRY